MTILLGFAINVGDQAEAYTGDGPSIYGLSPSGTINTNTANIEVTFEGLIESGTETAYLDGVLLTGCSVTVSAPYGHGYYDPTINHLSCPVTGLSEGTHTIDVSAQNIADAGWGVSYDSGTFTVSTTPSPCVAGKPSLSLGEPAPFWGSWSDYLAGVLSVNWTISNTGGTVAYDTTLTNTSNTNGVTMVVPSASLGTIAGGGSAIATLKYGGLVTGGYTTIGSWRTVNTGTAEDECGTLYTYP